jgi:hypothetical protein
MRRLIAVLTAVLLLLCQTSALAQLCVTDTPGETPAAAAPCHGMRDASSQPAPASTCEASQALAETSKVPVFLFPAEPVLVIATRHLARPLKSATHAAVHAVCSSPPLTVLHCRFLN